MLGDHVGRNEPETEHEQERHDDHVVEVPEDGDEVRDEIVAEMNMVAEGVKTTAAVLEIAAREHVEMPLAEHVGRVLDGSAQPAEIVRDLMLRTAKSEMHGIR